jgi:2'-5' RNA ligase
MRSQLSLFVPPRVSVGIEAVRRIVDPVQSRLIPAHVTLCREDELNGIGVADIAARLRDSRRGPISLRFGPPERFGGHGILMPCIAGTADFALLREVVLGTTGIRAHAPHLTLAHPRNPRAQGNDLSAVASLRDGVTVTFDEVQLIDQDADAPWVLRATFPLLAT